MAPTHLWQFTHKWTFRRLQSWDLLNRRVISNEWRDHFIHLIKWVDETNTSSIHTRVVFYAASCKINGNTLGCKQMGNENVVRTTERIMKIKAVAAYSLQKRAMVCYKDHCYTCSYLNMLLNDLRLGQTTMVIKFEDDTKFIDCRSVKRAQRFKTIEEQTKYLQKIPGWICSWHSHMNYLSGEKIIWNKDILWESNLEMNTD